MVGDDIRMIAGNKLLFFLRFDRRCSPTSQTSRRRRNIFPRDNKHRPLGTIENTSVYSFKRKKSMERVSAESDVTLKYVSYICVLFRNKMYQGKESNTKKNFK